VIHRPFAFIVESLRNVYSLYYRIYKQHMYIVGKTKKNMTSSFRNR